MKNSITRNLVAVLAGISIFLFLASCQNPFLQLGSSGASNAGGGGDFSFLLGPAGGEGPGAPKSSFTGTVTVKFYWPGNYYTYVDVPVCTQEVDFVDGVMVEDIDWDAVYSAYSGHSVLYEGYPHSSQFGVHKSFAWFYGTEWAGMDNETFESFITGWYFNNGEEVEHYANSEYGHGPEIDIVEQCVDIDDQLEISLAPRFMTKTANIYLYDTDDIISLYLNMVVEIAPGNIDEFLDHFYTLFDHENTVSSVDVYWMTGNGHWLDILSTFYNFMGFSFSSFPWDEVLFVSGMEGGFDGKTIHYLVHKL